MKTKFICTGTYVSNKNTEQIGKVISVDRQNGTAVVEAARGYRSDALRNLNVISYKEVE